MSVTFCGHAQVLEKRKVREWLLKITKEMIEKGERTFYLGGYGEFDLMAADVLDEHKKQYPQIERILVLPYINSKPCMKKYDCAVYPSLENVPRRYAVVRRNRWMIDNTDIVIAYVTHDWGGAAKTFEYAKRKKKRAICWAE